MNFVEEFLADPGHDRTEYDWLHTPRDGEEPLAPIRANYLYELALRYNPGMLVSLKGRSGAWTKHKPVIRKSDREFHDWKAVLNAYEAHRQILPFEIVIESDYPTYAENVAAARLFGQVVEPLGFVPNYWSSGGKGVHAHVWVDFAAFTGVEAVTRKEIIGLFGSAEKFGEAFILWLRRELRTLFGTKARKYDENLDSAKHLIRAEGYRHSGSGRYKTYLGSSWRDLGAHIPEARPGGLHAVFVRNQFSVLPDPDAWLVDFLEARAASKQRSLADRKQSSMLRFFGGQAGTHPAVLLMLSDEFKLAGDGYKRAAFYIANSRVAEGWSTDAVRGELEEWSGRMGGVLRPVDVDGLSRKASSYTFSDSRFAEFLEGLGWRWTGHGYERVK